MIYNRKVPTGNILIVNGQYGKLECLSIGDYGKENNIKADFLGLTKEINGVNSKKCIPLTEKWVITISTQYGCSMGCTFCDVPKVGKGRNATLEDLFLQIETAKNIHPEIKYSDRLNIHFARMGEPSFNCDVLDCFEQLLNKYDNFKIHPVISTMLPKKNKYLDNFLNWAMILKNYGYNGEAGLQFSINSTNDKEREIMFNGNSLLLNDISYLSKNFRPKGRKITLNFALSNYEVDAKKLVKLFNPDYFIVKITPMHETKSCLKNNLITENGYKSYIPYQEVENNLKKEGFDVIVFIPSIDEDVSKITCGNAILSEDFK